MMRSPLTVIAAFVILGGAACSGAEEETDASAAGHGATAPRTPADAPMDTMSVHGDSMHSPAAPPDTLHTTTHL